MNKVEKCSLIENLRANEWNLQCWIQPGNVLSHFKIVIWNISTLACTENFHIFRSGRSDNFYAKFMQAVKMLALCIHKIYILQTLKCNRSNITGSNKTNSSRIFPLFLSLMSAMIWAFISHMLFTQKNERAVNENVARIFSEYSMAFPWKDEGDSRFLLSIAHESFIRSLSSPDLPPYLHTAPLRFSLNLWKSFSEIPKCLRM